MYGVFPYFFAKTLMDTPVLIISPFIAAMIIYWAVGLQHTFEQFMKYFLCLTIVAQTASSIGYFVSATFEEQQTAMSFAPLMVMPMILFGGLMSNNSVAVDWLQWIQYVSPIKYCAEAGMWNEFSED